MRILIYGGGAVGLGIASCLLKSTPRSCLQQEDTGVDIIARENTVKLLRMHGLLRTGIFGDYYADSTAFGSFASLNELEKKTLAPASPDASRGSGYDYILVCIKSFDSLQAAKDLAKHKFLLNEKTKIILFQNGWGNAEIFAIFFSKDKIYNVRVITGFKRPKENKVNITVHADAIHIGSLFNGDLSGVENLCELISKGDIPCQTTNEIEKDLWAKMLYNCTLNSLSAILDVPYGALAENEFSRAIMNAISEEIFDVMTAAGYKTHWPAAKDFLAVFYNRLVPDTATHRSSTLQDVNAKKKTEIDALNGAVIRLAEKYKIHTPYNLVVYNIIKFIESVAVGR